VRDLAALCQIVNVLPGPAGPFRDFRGADQLGKQE
jgi:hypothetical protein